MTTIDRDQENDFAEDIEGEDRLSRLARTRVDRGTFIKAGGAAAAFAALAGVPVDALARGNLTKDFGLIEIVAAAFFDQIFNTPMPKYLGPRGWNLHVVTEQGQPTKGYAECQQFTLENYGIIANSTSDPMAGWESVASAATKKGICFIAHNPQALGPATQSVCFDHKFAGIQIGTHAAAWARRNNVKPVVGLIANLGDPEGRKRTDWAWNTIKNVPGAKLAGQVNAVVSQQQAAAGAANLLSAHPDINMIVCFNTVAGLGSYKSILQAGHSDRNKFYLAMVDYETAAGALVKQGTIVQALWGSYFAQSGILMCRDGIRYYNGHYIYPTRRLGGIVIANGKTVSAYDDSQAHPLAPKYNWIYHNKNFVRYSGKRLATGQSIDTIFH
jgi:ABC-type sugar transport system substrate-binding protein